MPTEPSLCTFNGASPKTPRFFFAAADSAYFTFFAPALAMSAHKCGNPLHLHVFNPSVEALNVADAANRLEGVTVTWHDTRECDGLTGKQWLSFCSNIRVHLLPELLALPHVERVYAIDIDSLFNRKHAMDEPEPIGLFLRDPAGLMVPDEVRHRYHVLCSMWWVDKSEIGYATACSLYIRLHDLAWCLDQEATHAAMESMGLRDQVADISKIDGLLDWHFRGHGVLWTGKGARKLDNPVFLEKMRALKAEFRARE